MGITTVPSAVTGQTLSAAQWNTQVRDNINGIWVLTTSGDMLYATGASAAARLAIGTANQIMRSTGSVPAWADLSNIVAAKEIVASQAAGDIFYASSPTAIARLAKGSAYSFVRSNGTVPEYGTPTFRRYGGSSTDWSSPGVDGYYPPYELQQVGAVNLTMGSTVAVTFGVAYSAAPHVMLTISSISAGDNFYAPYIYALSATGFTVACASQSGSAATVIVNWVARGQ